MFHPNYTISHTILTHISQIEASKEVIENAPLIPYWERQFREEKALRQIHHSTKLEGNMLSLDEVQKVLDGETVVAKRREVQEVINYRKVTEYIDRFQKGDSLITEETLKDIHSLLVENILPTEWAGTYRTTNVVIQASDTKEVTHRAPNHELVPELMQSIFDWFNGEATLHVHPVLKSGILHVAIGKIHPFIEANGRSSRSISTLSLYDDGYDIKKFFSLDEYYDEDPISYYLALQTVDGLDGDMTKWLEFFCEGLAVELDRVKRRVLEMSKDFRLRKERGQIALNERQEEILKFLELHGQIRNQDWRDLFPDVSDDSILRDLKDMIDKDIVIKKGKTKAARYELVE
ncbi:Fic family protein [candidate division WWE3 bacterium]|uniref:Fic family protein n=1 Tax=candidate division WWE3 bacterium TaxID=2053526 RepID=A0A955RVW6_UNCKA|nr:Fic family protein [candidate division WWE3 bacterium]